jgi:succinoglycan biosynthesis transport protein ExoP
MDEQQRVGMMLWRGKYLVLLAVAAMLAVAAVLTLTTAKSYEATTILRVDQAAAPVNGSDAYNAQQASATQAVNYATLLTSTSFLQRVASKIENGFAFSGAGLAGHLGAHAITNTNLIAVTFTAGSRKDALHYARTVADQSIALFRADFVGTRTRQQATVQARLKIVAARIAALQAGSAPDAQQQIAALTIAQTDLTRQYGQALSEASSPSPVVLVAGPPTAPTSPVSPRPAFNLIIALFLGLLVGAGLAWLRERLTTGARRTASLSKPLTRDPLPAKPRARPARRRKANQGDAAGTP